MGELVVSLATLIAELVIEALLFLPMRIARWSQRSRMGQVFLRLIALALLIWWNALPLWAATNPALFSLPLAAAMFLASVLVLPAVLIADYKRGSWGALALASLLIISTILSVTLFLVP